MQSGCTPRRGRGGGPSRDAGHRFHAGTQGPGQLSGRAQHRPPGPGSHLFLPAAPGRRGHLALMIGLVIVSHSAKLAEGVCDLARQVAQGRVRIAAAGGTADPENPIGTDAFQVLQAIESVYSEDGVLVLMDLGSAVLSAETALELLGEERGSHAELCAGPLVEGAVAAAALAAAGAGLAEISREAQNALAGKAAQCPPLSYVRGSESTSEPRTSESGCLAEVTLTNRLGLHARPAAQLVRLARRYRAQVTLDNVAANSINAILSLGAREGH